MTRAGRGFVVKHRDHKPISAIHAGTGLAHLLTDGSNWASPVFSCLKRLGMMTLQLDDNFPAGDAPTVLLFLDSCTQW